MDIADTPLCNHQFKVGGNVKCSPATTHSILIIDLDVTHAWAHWAWTMCHQACVPPTMSIHDLNACGWRATAESTSFIFHRNERTRQAVKLGPGAVLIWPFFPSSLLSPLRYLLPSSPPLPIALCLDSSYRRTRHFALAMSGFPYYTRTAPIATKSYGSGLSLNLGIALLQDDDNDEQERTKRPQLDLLSFTPAPAYPDSSPSAAASAFWTKSSSWTGTSQGGENRWCGGIDMNQMPDYDDDAVVSSPNSTVSSFHADNPGSLSSSGNKRDRDTPTLTNENEVERASSRLSDEDEGDNTRKKLRLSKEQSALLEESFKKHNTLNPKQKIALAKQLNLRPRQVEVWFQNRRARTKLKQTEVDCEYLKRCCENLTEENRRLQKEVQELRALKICSPYLMQMPGASAATLTMCPSCERLATADTHLHRPWQPLPLPLPPNSSRSFQPPVRS